MPVYKNHTAQPIKPSTGHIIPPFGELTVGMDTARRWANEPYMRIKAAAGEFSAHPDEPEQPDQSDQPEITREYIAKAKRSELLKIILQHYPDANEGDFSEVKVEDKDDEDGLRTIAARILFGDDGDV